MKTSQKSYRKKRYHNDPDYRKKILAQSHVRRMKKYHNNPDFHIKFNEISAKARRDQYRCAKIFCEKIDPEKLLEIICPVCGIKFGITIKLFNSSFKATGKPRRFCSHHCASIAQTKKWQQHESPYSKKIKKNKTSDKGAIMKLADAIALANIRDMVPPRGGRRGNSHPLPQPCLIFVRITQGKHAYDSCCHCAGGKCDRCRASGCVDRDWRKKGRDLP